MASSDNNSVHTDFSSIPSRHLTQQETKQDTRHGYLPRRSDEDDETIFTTDEELKQLLAKLDSAQGALISGKTSLSVTSKQSDNSSKVGRSKPRKNSDGNQHKRQKQVDDGDSLDTSTIPSFGIKISNEELDQKLAEISLQPQPSSPSAGGGGRRNSNRKVNSRPNSREGAQRPPSSGTQRIAKIPSSLKDTDAFLKAFQQEKTTLQSLSNPPSPSTGLYGGMSSEENNTPYGYEEYPTPSLNHHTYPHVIREGEGEENTPTKPLQQESSEDTIQFINNRLFAATATAAEGGGTGGGGGMGSYSTAPRYLQPTVASVLPPYLHGEIERVRNSYRTGSYNSLKKLPTKLEAGNVQLTAKQQRTVNLITSHNHSFKPASKLKDYAFQPYEHVGTDYEKVSNLNKFIFEEEKVQTESYSRKPFKISYRMRTKFEDTFFDPSFRVADMGPGGNNLQLESVTRSDPINPIYGKFHVARGKMAVGSGLIVKDWVKQMHQQLTKDWFDYEFRVKFTLSNEFLIQFLVPDNGEDDEEGQEGDDGMMSPSRQPSGRLIHSNQSGSNSNQRLPFANNGVLTPPDDVENTQPFGGNHLQKLQAHANKSAKVFPPPNNIIPKYMARFATHGLGKEFQLTKRGDRWNIIEEESLSTNDTLSTANDDDSIDEDDERHLEMLNHMGAISIGAVGVVQAVRRFSMLRTDTSSRTTSRAVSLDEYDNAPSPGKRASNAGTPVILSTLSTPKAAAAAANGNNHNPNLLGNIPGGGGIVQVPSSSSYGAGSSGNQPAKVSNVEQVSLLNIQSSVNSGVGTFHNASGHHYVHQQQQHNNNLRHSMSVALSNTTMNTAPGTAHLSKQSSGGISSLVKRSLLGMEGLRVDSNDDNLDGGALNLQSLQGNNVPFSYNNNIHASNTSGRKSTKSAKSIVKRQYLTFAFYAPWISCSTYNTNKVTGLRNRNLARAYAKKKQEKWLESLPPAERGLAPLPSNDDHKKSSVGDDSTLLEENGMEILKVFSSALVTGKTSSALGHALLDGKHPTTATGGNGTQPKPEKEKVLSSLEMKRQLLLGRKTIGNSGDKLVSLSQGGSNEALLSARDNSFAGIEA